MPTIYVSDPIHEVVVDELRSMGDVYFGYGRAATPYGEVCQHVDAVLLRAEEFTREKIAASPKLKIIARHGVGTNNVDLTAAHDYGVPVTIAPGRNSRAVAEHTIALILALARKVTTASNRVRAGFWSEGKPELTGIELSGRTLGLLGLGNVGSIVAGLGKAFGMELIVCDPGITESVANAVGARKVEFVELLEHSGVLSLHAPLTPATRHLIGHAQLNRVRPGTLLINTARGGLVDEEAMVAALRSGLLGGAAVDVLEAEGSDMRRPLRYCGIPLSKFDNLIVTPHIGGQTDESLRQVGRAAAACIRQVLEGVTPDNLVRHAPGPSDGGSARAR